MICPYCNSELPEGLMVCFRCGKPLGTFAPPRQEQEHEASQAYMPLPTPQTSQAERQSGTDMAQQPHVAGYVEQPYTEQPNANRPYTEQSYTNQLYTEQSYANQPYADPSNTGQSYAPQPDATDASPSGRRSKKGNIKVAVIVLAVLLLLSGGTVGGHFLGIYTLPFLPERGAAVDSAKAILEADEQESPNDDDADHIDKAQEWADANDQELADNEPPAAVEPAEPEPELAAEEAGMEYEPSVFELSLSGGYSIRVQPTGERSGIFTLTDPQLWSSYPEFSEVLSENGLMYLWQIKILPFEYDLALIHFNYQDRTDSEYEYLETEQMQSGVFANSRLLIDSIPVAVSGQSITWELEIPEEVEFDWAAVTECEVKVERTEEDYWFAETFSFPSAWAEGVVGSEKVAGRERALAEMYGYEGGAIGDMQLQYSLPHLDVYTDPQDSRHAAVTLSGYPISEWIAREREAVDEDSGGFLLNVYFSTDGENLYSVYGDCWPGMNENFYEDNYGIQGGFTSHYDDYNSSVDTAAYCVVTEVTDDSISWDIILTDEEFFDWNELNYIGFDVFDYGSSYYNSYTYVQLDGNWMEAEGTTMRDYFREMHSPQVWFEGVINGDSGEEMLSIENTNVTVLDNGDYQCEVTFANEMDWSVNVDILMDVRYDSENYESNIVVAEDAVILEDSTLKYTFILAIDNPEEPCQIWFYYYHN